MINSNAYDYVNVLGKAADASWTRNTLISNNIANNDTPNYKRQDIDFESCLSMALGTSSVSSGNLNSRVASLNTDNLTANIYTDNAYLSYRMDGNNVDIDTENSYLAQNQIKFNTLLDSISQEFSRLKSVLQK